MARATIHISVPDWMRSYVERRVETAGYGSVSEYLRQLIREDRQCQRNIAAMARRAAAPVVTAYRPLASAAGRRK